MVSEWDAFILMAGARRPPPVDARCAEHVCNYRDSAAYEANNARKQARIGAIMACLKARPGATSQDVAAHLGAAFETIRTTMTDLLHADTLFKVRVGNIHQWYIRGATISEKTRRPTKFERSTAAMLIIVKEHPGLGFKALARRADCSISTAQKYLNTLLISGAVTRHAQGVGFVWMASHGTKRE